MKSLHRRALYRRTFSTAARLFSLCFLTFAASCSGGSNGSSQSSLTPALTAQAIGDSASADREALSIAQASQTPLLPPAGTIYFGAFVNFLKMLGPYETQTLQFEQQIGRTLGIHAEYYKWTEPFPNAQEVDDSNHGRIAVESWDCGDTNYNVANGKQDAVIKAHALAFKQYGKRVFLRWMWEMNLPYREENRPKCIDPKRDVNGFFSPTDYIAAWNHIRAVFAAEGVTNVVWVWCPSGSVAGRTYPIPYYPGANQTDWVGFDHYDVTGKQGLTYVLSPYSVIAPLKKPIMIGESGSAPIGQASFFANAPALMQKHYPLILGFMYYDAYGHRQDWRLLSAGLKAYATAGATPYFSGMLQSR